MTLTSRRDFLRAITAAAVVTLTPPFESLGQTAQPALNLLVVGDSLIWGQGLEEKDKFYTLTANWLREHAFGRPRPVDLKVKAHSGANLKVHESTAEAFKKAGLVDTFSFHPEVNVGFPSIWTQIDTAAKEYRAARMTRGADLIMLTGGITDVSVDKILDPFGDEDELPPLIRKHCRDDMIEVLRHASAMHPNAAVIVLGYYPMLAPDTPGSKLMNAWLESASFPGALKRVANNPLTRRLFFGRIKKDVIKRSRMWTELSNENLQLAVDTFNTSLPQKRAIFIRSPITEETSYEMPNTLVFKLGRDDRSEDPFAEQRAAECKRSFAELKKKTGLDNSVRRCELAGLGHPDPAGSLAYFDSIRNAIASESWLIRKLASVR